VPVYRLRLAVYRLVSSVRNATAFKISSGRASMRRLRRDEIAALLIRVLDKAVAVQTPVVRAHVERVQKHNPAKSPQELIDTLEKQYLAAVATMGGAAGAAAAVPGAGTAIALPANLIEIGGFIEATTLFVLALAEVHGIDVEDLPRRRALVLAVMMGSGGSKVIEKIAGRTGPHWARQLVKAIPISTIAAINKALGKNFVTKYGTKQGILVLGREVPFGIGAVIGAGGNLGLGYLSVRAARHAFGPPFDTADPHLW
jgi:hypothetical protein